MSSDFIFQFFFNCITSHWICQNASWVIFLGEKLPSLKNDRCKKQHWTKIYLYVSIIHPVVFWINVEAYNIIFQAIFVILSILSNLRIWLVNSRKWLVKKLAKKPFGLLDQNEKKTWTRERRLIFSKLEILLFLDAETRYSVNFHNFQLLSKS